MKIDIPFRVEIYPTLESLPFHEYSPFITKSLCDIICRDAKDSRWVKHPERDIPNAYYHIIKNLPGIWTVIGTLKRNDITYFIIIKPGRLVSSVPWLFCKVIENPLEVTGEAKHA